MEFVGVLTTPVSVSLRVRKKTQIEHIKTFLRVRPLNDAETSRGSRSIVNCPENSREVVVNERPTDKITRKFTFDKVFGTNSKQINVYKCVAAPLIKEVLDGYNCTIFAYGQTGAGKTYTMEGRRSSDSSVSWTSDLHAGIIPRAVGHLFDELRLLNAEYSVKASFLEIYNEEIFDLLSPIDDTNKLRLYDDAMKKGAVIVSGLDEIAVRNKEDVYAMLDRGSRKRQTAATLMNAASSRSHTVFSITVRIRENAVDENELLRTGKLNLVDLAGSENIGRSGAIEKRAREAGNINQSLLTLGRVITALVEKTPHVPYRESKLTRLLQESLGGRTKTCIIATISPSQCNLEETLSTLDYAHRAKNIQNKPEVNQKIGKVALLQEYIEQIQRLKTDLTAAREKNGIWLAQDNYNEMMIQIDNQKRELSGLLQNVKTLTDTLERKEELNRELNESLQNYLRELQNTKNSLEESKVVLQHHVDTERKLHEQAENLLSVADIATNDTNLLHQTLVRKRKVEAQNLAACTHVTNTSRNRLFDIQQLVSDFQENRMKTAHEIKSICDTSQEIREVRSQQMKDNIGKAMAFFTGFLRTLQKSKNTLVSQTKKKIDDTKSQCADFCQRNTDNVVGYQEDLFSIFEQMSGEMSLFVTENQKLIEHLVLTFEEQENKFLKIVASLNEHVHAAEEKLQLQEKVILNAKKTLMKQNNEMEKMNANFQTFFQQRAVDISKINENIEESLCSSRMITSDLNNVGLEMDSMKNYSETWNNIKAPLDANKKMAVPIAKSIESFNSVLCEKIMEQKSNFSEQQIQFLGTTHGNLDTVSEVLLNYQCEQEKEIKKLDEYAQEFFVAQNNLVEHTKNEQIQLIEDCKNHVCNDNEHIKIWTENATRNISECVYTVEKFITEDITEDISSGRTPQRREFIYPRTLATTSPHERIVSRFRAAKLNNMLEESSTSSEQSSAEGLQECCTDSESSERLQIPMNNLNASYSGRTELSERSLQNQIGECSSKSSSNLYSESSMLPCSSKSEPSIPDRLRNKENSSSDVVSGVKQRDIKRQVLTERN